MKFVEVKLNSDESLEEDMNELVLRRTVGVAHDQPLSAQEHQKGKVVTQLQLLPCEQPLCDNLSPVV